MRFRKNSYLESLRSSRLFRSCNRKQLICIGALATRIDLDAGCDLYRQGENPAEFYVILDGEASISIDGRSVGTLSSGDFAGETELLAGGPRRSTLTAASAVKLLVFSRAEFRACLYVAPPAAYLIMRHQAERLRDAQTVIASLKAPLLGAHVSGNGACRLEFDGSNSAELEREA